MISISWPSHHHTNIAHELAANVVGGTLDASDFVGTIVSNLPLHFLVKKTVILHRNVSRHRKPLEMRTIIEPYTVPAM
jgi:hypothetical protein